MHPGVDDRTILARSHSEREEESGRLPLPGFYATAEWSNLWTGVSCLRRNIHVLQRDIPEACGKARGAGKRGEAGTRGEREVGKYVLVLGFQCQSETLPFAPASAAHAPVGVRINSRRISNGAGGARAEGDGVIALVLNTHGAEDGVVGGGRAVALAAELVGGHGTVVPRRARVSVIAGVVRDGDRRPRGAEQGGEVDHVGEHGALGKAGPGLPRNSRSLPPDWPSPSHFVPQIWFISPLYSRGGCD
eukprot:830923-Rhodomonas_salina.1